MVNYVKAAATAKRLIEANGRTVVLYRKNTTPADTNKPWRQPASTINEVVASPKGIFYPIEDKDEKDGLVRRSEQRLMIAHDSLSPPEVLDDIDHVSDNGYIYKVVSAIPLQPGDVRIAYEFILKR